MQKNRLEKGGYINRRKKIRFIYDKTIYSAFEGDSLASALLAHNCKIVARSFKYHRPRGIFTADEQEPNALFTIGQGARQTPNVKATTCQLYDGLVAQSQNAWPSVHFDLMAINNLLSPFISAGFYYKTFIGPTRKSWMFYEYFIRRAAGLGKATQKPDPDIYEKLNLFCDVLIVGAGIAGLNAAISAASAGARVIIAEQDNMLGGALLREPIDSLEGQWRKDLINEIEESPNIRVLKKTYVWGAYDHGIFTAIQKNAHHQPLEKNQPRQRSLIIHTKNAVIATGAHERPLVFANNDKPGIMLASALRTYLNRYAVLPAKKIIIFTNNDTPYQLANELTQNGAQVTIIDPRENIPENIRAIIQNTSLTIKKGHVIAAPIGRKYVCGAHIVPYPINPNHKGETHECDLIAVSGGWSPILHLCAQRGKKPVWKDEIAAFIAQDIPKEQIHAGATTGIAALGECARSGQNAGKNAAKRAGYAKKIHTNILQKYAHNLQNENINHMPLWDVGEVKKYKNKKRFVDMQNDATTKDIHIAHREGYDNVEHMKRYTTLGMGAEQGKLANVNAIAILAEHNQKTIPQTGTTTFRPPYIPVSIGAVVADKVGKHFQPIRRSPLHEWHIKNGAVMTEAGLWVRPWYYPKGGEDIHAAYKREADHVRNHVAITDVSSLGKINVQGPDATEFLNRVYVNAFSKLPVGKARYAVMLREDGFVYDDGTVSHIKQNHYFLTTTTLNAPQIIGHLDYLAQCCWPELNVAITSVSDQWAGIAIAGPYARKTLKNAVDDINLENENLPFMGVTHGHIRNIPIRLLRVSFSGELAYEVYVPAGYAEKIWKILLKIGEKYNIIPYGLEALGTLRIEKGHIAGNDIDGRVTLDDLQMHNMIRTKKPFVGKILAQREELHNPNRPKFAGFISDNPDLPIYGGSIIMARGEKHQGHGIGHISSATYSPALKKYIALGFIQGGLKKWDKISVDICNPVHNQTASATVTSPHFYDPQGVRLKG